MDSLAPRAQYRRGSSAAAALVILVVGAALAPVSPAAAVITPTEGVQLKVASTNKCINVKAPSTADNTPIVQYDCWADLAKNSFKAVPKGGGTYQIVEVTSGRCLNVKQALTTDNTPILLYSCSASARNDRWGFRSVPGRPSFQLVAAHSGKCIHVGSNSSADNAPLVQYTCGTGPIGLNEQFTFPPVYSATPTRPPESHNSPVAVTQGAPEAGASVAPLTYAYLDDSGTLMVGHQPNPDFYQNVQWSAMAGLEGFTDRALTAVQADGRVQIAARNSADGDVWTVTQSAKGVPSFGTPQDVGGADTSATAIGRTPDGKLVAFVSSGDGLWHLPQDGTNTPYAGWRYIGWSGGDACPYCVSLNSPTTVTMRDSLRIFALIDRNWELPDHSSSELEMVTYQGGRLSAPIALGGAELDLVGTPAVVVYPGFRTRVFVRTAAGTIVTKLENLDGTFPAAWLPVGDFVAAGPPAAVVDPGSGRTAVVARGADGKVHYVAETRQASGQWGDWKPVSAGGVVTDPTVLAFTQTNGRTWGFVVRDENGRTLMYTIRDVDGAALRSAGEQPAFTAHGLPLPPR